MTNSELDKELDQVLVDLSSVLLACNDGVPANRVVKELRDLTEYELDVKKFGYGTIDDFLRQFRDRFEYRAGKWYARALNESMVNIMEQKNSGAKRGAARRRDGGGAGVGGGGFRGGPVSRRARGGPQPKYESAFTNNRSFVPRKPQEARRRSPLENTPSVSSFTANTARHTNGGPSRMDGPSVPSLLTGDYRNPVEYDDSWQEDDGWSGANGTRAEFYNTSFNRENGYGPYNDNYYNNYQQPQHNANDYGGEYRSRSGSPHGYGRRDYSDDYYPERYDNEGFYENRGNYDRSGRGSPTVQEKFDCPPWSAHNSQGYRDESPPSYNYGYNSMSDNHVQNFHQEPHRPDNTRLPPGLDIQPPPGLDDRSRPPTARNPNDIVSKFGEKVRASSKSVSRARRTESPGTIAPPPGLPPPSRPPASTAATSASVIAAVPASASTQRAPAKGYISVTTKPLTDEQGRTLEESQLLEQTQRAPAKGYISVTTTPLTDEQGRTLEESQLLEQMIACLREQKEPMMASVLAKKLSSSVEIVRWVYMINRSSQGIFKQNDVNMKNDALIELREWTADKLKVSTIEERLPEIPSQCSQMGSAVRHPKLDQPDFNKEVALDEVINFKKFESFHVRLLEDKEKYTKVKNRLRAIYCNAKASEASFVEKDVVCVQVGEMFYRAVVLKPTVDGVKANLIDTGADVSVSTGKVWPLVRELDPERRHPLSLHCRTEYFCILPKKRVAYKRELSLFSDLVIEFPSGLSINTHGVDGDMLVVNLNHVHQREEALVNQKMPVSLVKQGLIEII